MTVDTLHNPEQEIDQLVDRFVQALDAGDLAAAKSLFTPDGVVWHNFDQQAMPCAAALGMLEGAAGKGMHYFVSWRHILVDGCVQQHVIRGRGPASELVEMPVMWRVFVDGNLISRVDEYFDTAQAAAILAAAGSAANVGTEAGTG
jgi:ketosteroid isomerase-like protein